MSRPSAAETFAPVAEVEHASFAEAITAAGRVYAEAIARQDARPAREAAREALGRTATPEQIDAWVAEFRPPVKHRQTA